VFTAALPRKGKERKKDKREGEERERKKNKRRGGKREDLLRYLPPSPPK